MRVLTERLKDRRLDLTDGIKVFDERGWAHVLPDPDEPLLHLYAEGGTVEESKALESELRALVEQIMDSDFAQDLISKARRLRQRVKKADEEKAE